MALLGMFMTTMLFFFFLFTPKGNRNENRILAGLLIVFGFQIFIALAMGNYTNQYFLRSHLYIYVLKLTRLTAAPLLYYYLIAFLNKNKSIKIPFIQFVPFFCSLIFFGYYNFDINVIAATGLYVDAACLIQGLVYIISSINYLKKRKVQYNSGFPGFSDFTLVNWLQIILFGYIAIWIIQLNFFSVYVILRQPGWCAYTSSICMLLIFVFTLIIMFILLLKPDIYCAFKYRSSRLNEIVKPEYLQKLNKYLELEKAYLNPELSLDHVAAEILISQRVLSQIINESYNMNFKSLINEFRIKECVRMISVDTNCEKTIQEVYYSAGFNSRSVFNELFKAYTGMTPKEFREKTKTAGNLNK
jgi:AraC-like DNA-binding protein